MGYVPPTAPTGNPLPDFGQQYIFGVPKNRPPETPYRRYIWDLYGPPSRSWFVVLNYALLVGLIALVMAVGWLFIGGSA